MFIPTTDNTFKTISIHKHTKEVVLKRSGYHFGKSATSIQMEEFHLQFKDISIMYARERNSKVFDIIVLHSVLIYNNHRTVVVYTYLSIHNYLKKEEFHLNSRIHISVMYARERISLCIICIIADFI